MITSPLSNRFFPATREHGLLRLDDFASCMGRTYAARRNFDLGAGNHTHVSTLSPFIRHRLITETEVIAAAIETHGLDEAEKFIHEVVWRSYFKGFMERRPALWADYKAKRDHELANLQTGANLQNRYEGAIAGSSGIDCFDHWVKELVTTGYLHNHARMWFASIWIFTLHLPWELGADYFLRHLLDGDPASNTLSWRWVGGLHTKGKAYEAKAWNIAKFTNGRFSPLPGELAEDIEPLDWGTGLPELSPVPAINPPDRNAKAILLVTPEDCQPETLIRAERNQSTLFDDETGMDPQNIKSVMATSTIALRASAVSGSSGKTGMHADRFEMEALRDAMERASGSGLPVEQTLTEPLKAARPTNNMDGKDAAVSALIELADRHDAQQIVTAYAPMGPTRDWLDTAEPQLMAAGLSLHTLRREWDDLAWPHATAGFFKLKKKISDLVQQAGLVGGVRQAFLDM